ncbi:MAG: hypothetical protein Q9163_002213 [Psora crenata]
MAPRQARQERLLERQRGAGSRQVKNLDIGLILPGQDNGTLQPQKSGRRGRPPRRETLPSRRTPAPELHAQRSSRRTPAAELAPEKSTRRTPVPDLLPPQPLLRQAPEIETSAKRARSMSEDGAQGQGKNGIITARTKKRKFQDESAPIEEEPISLAVEGDVPWPKHPDQDVATAQSPKKRKKRKSIGQRSSKRLKTMGSPHMQLQSNKSDPRRGRPSRKAPSPIIEALNDDMNHTYQNQTRKETTEPSSQARRTEQEFVELPGVQPISGHKSKEAQKMKRVSIGPQPTEMVQSTISTVKEEPAEEEVSSLQQASENQAAYTEQADEPEPHVQDRHPPTSTRQAKPKRKKKRPIGQQRPKRASKDIPAPLKAVLGSGAVRRVGRPATRPQAGVNIADDKRQQVSAGGVNSQSIPAERAPRPGRPKKVPSNTDDPQPRAKASTKTRNPPKPASSRAPVKKSIPVPAYRTPTPSLSLASDDIAEVHSTTQSPKAPTTVDTSAQLTIERLEELSRKLSSQSPASSSEQETLELYMVELEKRTGQLSRALETNAAVSKRVAAVEKDERQLKMEIKRVGDEKKRACERMEELLKEQKRAQLEDLLGRIASVVAKGWEMEGLQVTITASS